LDSARLPSEVQHVTSDIEWGLVGTDRAMLEGEASVLDRQAAEIADGAADDVSEAVA